MPDRLRGCFLQVQLAAHVCGSDKVRLITAKCCQFALPQAQTAVALQDGVGSGRAAAEMVIAGGGQFEAGTGKNLAYLTVGTQRMLYGGAVLCAAAGALLLVVGTLPASGPWLLILGLFCYVSCTGLLGANCTASLMALYPDNAGAAAGLAVATQFGLSAVASTLTSALYSGTPAALTLVVGICGIGSLLALGLTRERHATA